jgi:hypothetical protein
MDRGTREAIVELYDRTIAEEKADLASLEPSSQEFGKGSTCDGTWEDLKPREIARLQRSIAEYEALRRELTGE